MPLAVLLASIGGGRITVGSPTITHAPGVGFTISDYDASLVYTLSAGSRSGDTITLDWSTPATISACAPKCVSPSAAVTIERRQITYTSPRFILTNFYTYNGPCAVGDVCYGTCGAGINNCGRQEGYYVYDGEDSPPAGFVKLNNEWVKIA